MELSQEEIQNADCLDLIAYIGWKDEYPEEAKCAFEEFIIRFDKDVKKMSEVSCLRWGYNEVIALVVVECSFRKVWMYPTYNHEKSKVSNVKKGIKLWLHRIVYTQLANYNNKGYCFEPDKDTDLSLIYSIEELVNKSATSDEKRRMLLKRLEVVEEALNQVTVKHKIIYLTYKLYVQDSNKKIPRQVSKKLQKELGLAAGSIRKYKQEANNKIKSYLSRING